MADAAQETPVRAPLPLKTFVTSVRAIEQRQHPFTRVTFQGGDLSQFESIGPDQFLYLLLPPPGGADLTIDAGFSWSQYRTMPEEQRPVGAYYTVRHHRPDLTEVDIDIVRHGHVGQVGAWLNRAQPGDPVALWGPRMAYHPPPSTTRQLLIGDETALPAIASILESDPIGTRVDVILELNPATEMCLPELSELSIARLEPPEQAGSSLPAALRNWPVESDAYVWGAGEFELMRELKSYLRDCVQLPANQVSVIGYWRRDSE